MWVLSVLAILGMMAILLAFAVLGALQAGGTALLVVSGLMLIVLGVVALTAFWFAMWFNTPRHEQLIERHAPPSSRRDLDRLQRDLRVRDSEIAELKRDIAQLKEIQARQTASMSQQAPPEVRPAFHEEYDPDTGEFHAHSYAPSRQMETHKRVPARNGNGSNGHYRR